MRMDLGKRKLYLITGTVALLFAGIIYAWSILKVPLAEQFGLSVSALALNYTLTMVFFCLGGIVGSLIREKIGLRLTLMVAACLAAAGFILTGAVFNGSAGVLYLFYGVMTGLGIGISYTSILAAVGRWFPDRTGFCSGCLMMGFGASSLILGNLSNKLIGTVTFGWEKTFILIGICLLIVLCVAGNILKLPDASIQFPEEKRKSMTLNEKFEARDFTTGEMVRRSSFWRAFLCLVFLVAVGSVVISFARDLSVTLGAAPTTAAFMVGILSVCNGLGRILTGILFDRFGRRKTMLLSNVITICASAVILISVVSGSFAVFCIGICVAGLSYGSCPTIASAFTSAFFGKKHYGSNFSIMNCNLMVAALMATVCGKLQTMTGGFTTSFIVLMILTVAALALNLSIRRP